MQLTQFTDYALRTLVYLGANDDRVSTIGQIAATYGISDNHLMKVVNRLAARGYVRTIRGKGGGLRLARPAAEVRLGQLVRDMEERFDLAVCFQNDRQDCVLLPDCMIKDVLSSATNAFLRELDRHTVQDVLDGGASSALLRVQGVPIALPGRS